MTISQTTPFADGMVITGPLAPHFDEILTPEAVAFVGLLQRTFNGRRRALLEQRIARQNAFDAGQCFDFLPETQEIRDAAWVIAPLPDDLQDRRVEITGPVDRKMVINALNSGAKVFMADFEDANSPTWANLIEGQINLRDAIRRTISFRGPDGKDYLLHDQVAVLFARPRGWHLSEKHMTQDGAPVSGSLFDFGLYAFHNARELLARGSGPYFYLPKMESHLEARLWNDVFNLTEQTLGIPAGSIKATVLIETLPAAFEMDEILYELRDHSAGLNCGRWDYIFSAIKKRRNDPTFILPDRAQVTMTTHFMRSYAQLCIKTCHRRSAHAMGGMSAYIPVKSDPEVNERALAQVRADKEREATDGHDGTWVAHPGLVPIAADIFDRVMPTPNQIGRTREDVQVTAADLQAVPEGTITEGGLRVNISVGIQYLESWLRGQGCVPINNLMEDAATAEISRAQVWQWIRHPQGKLEDGRKVTAELFRAIMREELARIEHTLGREEYDGRAFGDASDLFDRITTSDDFADFLTLPAYDDLP